jgi:hypothetical protein
MVFKMRFRKKIRRRGFGNGKISIKNGGINQRTEKTTRTAARTTTATKSTTCKKWFYL